MNRKPTWEQYRYRYEVYFGERYAELVDKNSKARSSGIRKHFNPDHLSSEQLARVKMDITEELWKELREQYEILFFC